MSATKKKTKKLNASTQTFLRNRLHVPGTHFLPLTIVPPNKPKSNNNRQLYCSSIEEHLSGAHVNWRYADILDCIALEEAVWILQLQRLLILYGAKPPGVVNDASEPHTW